MRITDQSIEALEQNVWESAGFSSHVVQTSLNARKKPISQLSDEEIRLLIGQKVGLPYLIPIALSVLREDPLAEISFYAGDLLSQLLRLSEDDWTHQKDDLRALQAIIRENRALIESCEEIPKQWIEQCLALS